MGKWISVKDKPVPYGTPIIVRAKNPPDNGITTIVEIDSKYSFPSSVGFYGIEEEPEFWLQHITHWMSLPEPPKEEK